VLLVAATEPELCRRAGLVCGVGPVEAAAATAARLAVGPLPGAVLHLGIAGGRDLPIPSLVVGTESRYCDLGAGIPVVSRVEPDDDLLATALAALPEARALPIGTSALVGAVPHDVPVEAMEGFGVLRACALARVPAVEVRAISNEVGETDRARWDVAGALAALDRALPALVAALEPPP
jgi:nucleoside phosphorylase